MSRPRLIVYLIQGKAHRRLVCDQVQVGFEAVDLHVRGDPANPDGNWEMVMADEVDRIDLEKE